MPYTYELFLDDLTGISHATQQFAEELKKIIPSTGSIPFLSQQKSEHLTFSGTLYAIHANYLVQVAFEYNLRVPQENDNVNIHIIPWSQIRRASIKLHELRPNRFVKKTLTLHIDGENDIQISSGTDYKQTPKEVDAFFDAVMQKF